MQACQGGGGGGGRDGTILLCSRVIHSDTVF